MRPRCFVVFAAVFVLWPSIAYAAGEGTLHIPVKRKLTPGIHRIVLNVYATPEGGTPLTTESRLVQADDNGSIEIPLSSFSAGDEERWIGIQIVPDAETKRVRIPRANETATRAVELVTGAAIWGNGIIASASGGFRFPDNTVQTTAATAVSYGTPVTIGSLNLAGTATTVARSDHQHAHGDLPGGTLHQLVTTNIPGFMSEWDKQKLDAIVPYLRTIIVNPAPGDQVQSGWKLYDALNISDSSSSNRYLVRIEPGTYLLPGGVVTLPAYVSIEGSGESLTFILGSAASGGPTSSAAPIVADNIEIRNLTLRNDHPDSGVQTTSVGLYATGSVTLRNVTLSTNALSHAYGIVCSADCDLNADHVTVAAIAADWTDPTASADALYTVEGSYVRVMNSTLQGSGGTTNYAIEAAGGVWARYSDLEGDVKTTLSLVIGHSFLTGSVSAVAPASAICYGTYNTYFAALTATCGN